MDRSLVEKVCENPKCPKPEKKYEVARRKEATSHFCSVPCMNAGKTVYPPRPCLCGCGKEAKGRHKYATKACYVRCQTGMQRAPYKNAGTRTAEWVTRLCDCGCGRTEERLASAVREGFFATTECFRRSPQYSTGRPATKIVGQRFLDTGGYVRIYVGMQDPRAYADGSRLEHIMVMEEHLGRYLLPGENVHHIHGDKTDNRLEHLELWVSSQPKGQRVEDMVDYARAILRRYAPQSLVPELRSDPTGDADVIWGDGHRRTVMPAGIDPDADPNGEDA